MSQQVFNIKISLPEHWKLNPETLKQMIEKQTIFSVDEIEDAAASKKPSITQIVTLWEVLKMQCADERHPEFGYDTYAFITREAAQWNVVNISHRSFEVVKP